LSLLVAGCNAAAVDVARVRAGADAHSLGVADALTKIRPDAAVPAATSAALDAARNEFEPFQIVVAGGTSGVHALTATAHDLVGPDGARIAAANLRLYQVGLYHVKYASNVEGAAGDWPDPLIPDVDPWMGEKRNGLPFDVAAGATRAIWVDVFVPPGSAAGMYAGSVTVSAAAGLPATEVPLSLRVRDFELPATASLQSAFGFSVDNACRAHHGTAYCTSNADAAPLVAVYGRAALDHRLSFFDPYYTMPTNGDFAAFDTTTGPLFAGTAKTALPSAHATTMALGTRDATASAAIRAHFDAKGWKGLFDYTCDEPPATCAFSDIPARAQVAHGAGVRTLVTTDIATMNTHGLLDAIDIACPVIDALQPAGAADVRASYDAFLARSANKEVWTYQSCDEHGCAQGCTAAQASATTSGWPTYMIDSSALQNRAMQWLDYKLRTSGELYFETVMHLEDAWNSAVAGHDGLCDFGGNGDGALFYPGTPAQIGGTTDVPVESVRLQLIREGMEDYEYLHLADTLGAGDDARATVAALFPAAWQVTQATPATLYAARAHLADLIEAKLGHAPPPVAIAHADAPVDLHGDGPAFAAATPITVGAGAASATFRMLWDDSALYIAADVADAQLSVIGTGHDGELWDADGVELLLDPLRERTASADAGDRHLIVTAAGDELEARGAGAGEDRSFVIGATTVVTTQGSVGGSTPATGYRVVAAIPWSGLGVTPAAGLVLGADLALNDLDGTQLTSGDWAGITPFAQPIRWNALVLAASGDGATPSDGLGGNGATTGNDGTSGGAHIRGCAVGADTDAPSWAWIVALAVAAVARRRRRSFVQDVL
jgi:MYXO-CTERM domain-containing protein